MGALGRIGVIGGGSWATAIMKMLTENEGVINWWVRGQDTVDHINKEHHNPRYISSVEFDPHHINVSVDMRSVVENSDTLILAVPSAFLKDAMETVDKQMFHGKTMFSAVKGIVPETLQIVGEFLFEYFDTPKENFGVICGPCHAEEVAMEKLSYLTIACPDTAKANAMAELLRSSYIRATPSDDIYGTEYGAVLKNIVAIASGICHGLGYGDNFNAVLISNAIQEMKRFVDTVHPIDRDIKGSAYLGDLLVTAYSQHSRNRMFGNMIGKGYSVKAAQMEMNMIAEGYYATEGVHRINEKVGVDMPITDAVFNILYGGKKPKPEMAALSEKLS